MGLPLTWVSLNLMQLFWIDYAYASAPKSATRNGNKFDETRICGDDLLGYWAPSVNR
jgi:hypothetical protein